MTRSFPSRICFWALALGTTLLACSDDFSVAPDGTSGTSGAGGGGATSGAAGSTTGAAGVSGSDAGTNGASGTSTAGTAGESGASGTAGQSGDAGTAGANAAASGAAGENGAAGMNGTAGMSGAGPEGGTSGAGPSGAAGAAGNGPGGPGPGGTAGANGAAGTSASGAAGTSANGAAGMSGVAGTAGSPINSGDCPTVGLHCVDSPGICTELTPGGFRVCVKEVHAATTCSEPEGQCCSTEDCPPATTCFEQPLKPYCGGFAPPLMGNVCVADECDASHPCGSGLFCVPPGAFGNAIRYCASAACQRDTDCVAEGQGPGICAPVVDNCCGGVPNNLLCVYYENEGCRGDSDCQAGKVCRLDTSNGTAYCKGSATACVNGGMTN